MAVLAPCLLLYTLLDFDRLIYHAGFGNSEVHTTNATVRSDLDNKTEEVQVWDDFPLEWKRDAERSFHYLKEHHIPSKEALEEAIEALHFGYHLRKLGNRLYKKIHSLRDGEDHNTALCQFVHMMCNNAINGDMDWVFNFADDPVSQEFPSFSWTKSISDLDILVPYQHSFRSMDRAGCNRPLPDFKTWKREKKNIAFWRGSTTGSGWKASTWKEYPRPKLVLYCKEHEDICDAKFVAYIQGAEHIPEMREMLGPEAPRISQAAVEENKFVIIVDGNGPPSSRILTQLQGHSLVLRQESPYYEFFYPSLQPYVHYVPVHVTDVGDAVEWARKHPKESYHMIVAARDLVCNTITRQSVDAYMSYVFEEYSSMYNGIHASVETADMQRVRFPGGIQQTCPDVPFDCPGFDNE